MDFETYSEAGYVFNGKNFEGLVKLKPGLPSVGVAVYALHPSAEISCLAYDEVDGTVQLWTPGMPPPTDLFDHIASGGLVHAWNAQFEWWVWNAIGHQRLGWPELPLSSIRCDQARGTIWGLPEKLAKAAAVLGTAEQKGDFAKKLTIPRKPTKKDPVLRYTPTAYPKEFADHYLYCMQDVRTESSIAERLPPMRPDELQIWMVDQRINARGVAVDMEGLEYCERIIAEVTARLTEELRAITGLPSVTIDQLNVIKAWSPYPLESLAAEYVEEVLGNPELPPAVRRVLEIRQLLSSASVRKVAAIRRMQYSGRLYNLLQYAGARQTGRWAGRGPQPQNLPRTGPKIWKDEIGLNWDGRGKEQKWKVEAVDFTLAGGAESCPDSLAAISGCLRGLFVAAPGHELISADYSAIEAVVLAVLAGEQWRIDVFNTHGKIYEMSASLISGVPFEEILGYVDIHKEHHPLRNSIGKVGELACFADGTQVMTNNGYKNITDVLLTDKLWDGSQWVNHAGVVNKGLKDVINLDGVQMTPSHPIFMKNSWKEARLLASSGSMLIQALEIGSENLPSLECLRRKEVDETSSRYVAAGGQNIPSIYTIYSMGDQRGVINALRKSRKKPGMLSTIGNMSPRWRIKSTGGACLTGFRRRLVVAKNKAIRCTQITEGEEYPFAKSGKPTKPLFSYMFRHFPAGIPQSLRWTGRTSMATMLRGIYGLSRGIRTRLTSAVCPRCKGESMNSKNVYDIVNAGPHNRFTIRTVSGHLIVHNSGFGGWIGAWKNFGADKFFRNDDEIKAAILKWREKSPMIVEFWGGRPGWKRKDYYGLEGMAVCALMSPGAPYSYRGITYQQRGGILYCKLPSGRELVYHNARLGMGGEILFDGWNSDSSKGRVGWCTRETYSGKLTENVVQAVSRDILAHALVNLEYGGYPVVLHVHDEVVSEVPMGAGSVEEFERIMSQMPPWAKGWPVRAAGGWRGRRYRK